MSVFIQSPSSLSYLSGTHSTIWMQTFSHIFGVIHEHTHTCMHACMHTCTCAHTYAYTHARTHTHTHTDMHVRTHIHIHTCAYAHTYAYTHARTHTHTHTHTPLSQQFKMHISHVSVASGILSTSCLDSCAVSLSLLSPPQPALLPDSPLMDEDRLR